MCVCAVSVVGLKQFVSGELFFALCIHVMDCAFQFGEDVKAYVAVIIDVHCLTSPGEFQAETLRRSHLPGGKGLGL